MSKNIVAFVEVFLAQLLAGLAVAYLAHAFSLAGC